MDISTLASVHLVATIFLAGVIVFVQIVHYPLMARVGAAEWLDFEAHHKLRTGFVVIVPMIVELGSAVWLWELLEGQDRWLASVGLGLLGIIWLSTALVQAPAHGRLSVGFDERVHRWLVHTNWVRTVAWLARVPIAVTLAL